jgi:hypothetical protein
MVERKVQAEKDQVEKYRAGSLQVGRRTGQFA